jgi:hypothetical protein
MRDLTEILRVVRFRWLPKHIQHIAENIVFKKRNISFLAINALFQQKKYWVDTSDFINNSFKIDGFVDIQPNDLLRTRAENLSVIFYLDKHDNIVVVTAFSENDEYSI